MTLEFTYSRDEYLRAVRFHYSRILHVKRDLVIVALVSLVGVYLLQVQGPSWLSLLVIGAAALFCLLLLIAFAVLPPLIYRSSSKLHSPYSLTFSEDEILFRTANIDSRLGWNLYTKWIAGPEFYLLFHGEREFTVIPRRVFTGPEQEDEFRRLVEHKIGPPS